MGPETCRVCGMKVEVSPCPFCGAHILASAADQDQELSDRDQTASDQDQTLQDQDQSSSDSDQRRSDEDQQASDEALSAGGDAVTHDRSKAARQRTTHDRAVVAEERDNTARDRVATAEERDRTSVLRERFSNDLGKKENGNGLTDYSDEIPQDLLIQARHDRARAAADRVRAADDRARAARDREEASRERAKTRENMAESERNLKLLTKDELTGVWSRKFGLEEVGRELERSHRTGAKLILAFVDVDGLKVLNDTQGHLAGDALLTLVGQTLLTHVRPYDVVVRYGGDEFICAMPTLTLYRAKERLDMIAEILRKADGEHSITFGLAEAEPDDDLRSLIARADAALLMARSL